MKFRRDVVGAIGRTPLIKLRAASEATGCTILGKAEFMNPGGSVKDRAALAIIEDAVARGALAARRRHRRRHRRQHRHRHRDGRQRARLSHRHRHSRHPGAGKEGHAAPRRRRADRGAGGPLFQPQQLRALFGPPRRGARARPNPTARSGRTSSTMSPTGAATTRRPGRRSSTTRRQARRLRLRRRHRRHARRRRHGAQGARPERSRSRSPIRWARRSIPITPPASSRCSGSSITEGIGQGRITANLEGAPVDFAYQIPDEEAAADRLRSRGARRAAARRFVGDQHRRRDPARPRTRPGPHDRDPLCATPARATPRSCSIPRFCARRTCRSRTGWRRRERRPRCSRR